MSTFYEILGVNQTASAQEIKRAYRDLVKIYHPDINPNRPDFGQRLALINEAYSVLRDPTKRAEYDNLLFLQVQSEMQADYSTQGTDAQQEIPHYACEHCGTQDSTLRVSIFIKVVSVFVVTQKTPELLILCSKCRLKHSLKLNFMNWLLGWWGFPWGPIYTIEALIKNLQGGEQPAENNVSLMNLLAYDFYRQNRYEESYKSLRTSWRLRADSQIKEYMDQMEAFIPEESRTYSSRRLETRPLFYNIAFLAILAGFSALILFPSIYKRGNGYSLPSSSQESYASPIFPPKQDPLVQRYSATSMSMLVNLRSSVASFFQGLQHFSDAKEIIQGFKKSDDREGDWAKIGELLINCNKCLANCDTDSMNTAFSGWGDILSSAFIPAINLYINSFTNEGDLSDIEQGDTKLSLFAEWWASNSGALMRVLEEKYGFQFQ